jgi:6-phosphogluconolactonase
MSRITLTAPLINQARNVLFLVTGENKSGILKTVLTAPRRPERYPAQLIRPEQGEVFWYVDGRAASRLPKGLVTLGSN